MKKIRIYPLITVFLYFFCIVRLSYITNINSYSLVACGIIFLYLLLKGININNKTNILLIVFCIFSIFSAIINMNNIDGTILFVFKTINIVFFIQYASRTKEDENISKILFILSVIMTLVTIYYQMTHPLSAWKNDLNYFIGSKFLVSYNALSSVIFFAYAFNKHSRKIIYNIVLAVIIALSFYTCIFVQCVTGIIGTIFIVIMLLLIKFNRLRNSKKIGLFMKPITPIMILVLSAFLVLVLQKIIAIPFINHIVTDVFGKSEDLSGRLIIYEAYPRYIDGHMLFGYGYNNVYELFKDTMRIRSNAFAFDAQNAFLEYFLYFGLMGCVSFLIFVKNCFSRLSKVKYEELDNKVYFVLGFYLLVFLGTIEITINPLFYVFLSFIAFGEKQKNLEEEI